MTLPSNLLLKLKMFYGWVEGKIETFKMVQLAELSQKCGPKQGLPAAAIQLIALAAATSTTARALADAPLYLGLVFRSAEAQHLTSNAPR